MKLRIIILTLFLITLISCSLDINPMKVVVKQDETIIENFMGSYDFGNIMTDRQSLAITFTIQNLGYCELKLLGSPELIKKSSDDYDAFIINQDTVVQKLSPKALTSFTVTFKPRVLGKHRATIHIHNSAYSYDPYFFAIRGNGIPHPEINVKQDAENIESGSGVYDFGTFLLGKSSPIMYFEIENTGQGELLLTDSKKFQVSGADASDFFINKTAISSPIYPNSSKPFSITFQPKSVGVKTATITIANNDLDENPYTFTIKGRCKEYKPKFDFNGDGFDDVIIGARNDDDNGRNSGCAFIFFGGPNPTSLIDASLADVKLVGNDTYDHFGGSVSTAGDFNKDGYDDVIVGASEDDDGGLDSGCAFIFFGSSNPPSVINASQANVTLVGNNYYDSFGNSVSDAGDLNKDGYADVIVGARSDDDGGDRSGCAFVFFGFYNPPSQLYASNAKMILVGGDILDFFGSSVSNAGDVNGDGYDDVIVGADYDDDNGAESGCAFIFFYKNGFPKIIDATNADVKLVGEGGSNHFGISVSCAGDVNGDGFDDIIVGAEKNNSIDNLGCAYIFFGRSSFPATIDAMNANVKLAGVERSDYFGRIVSNAGDVNGDGIDDVIVGALRNNVSGVNSGCSFVFFGNKSLSGQISAIDANIKLVGKSSYNNFGRNVSSAGDFNVDGYDDVMISTVNEEVIGVKPGSVYVYNGCRKPESKLDVSDAAVKLIGEDDGDDFGSSIAGGN